MAPNVSAFKEQGGSRTLYYDDEATRKELILGATSDFIVAGVPKTGVTSRRVKIMTLNKFIDVIIFERKSE